MARYIEIEELERLLEACHRVLDGLGESETPADTIEAAIRETCREVEEHLKILKV